MEEKEIVIKLGHLLDEERIEHSIGVKECAAELAKIYNEDVSKAAIAGLLHDCAKGFDDHQLIQKSKEYNVKLDPISVLQKELIHGPLGAKIAKHLFNIKDKDILSAIEYHTYGRKDMTVLEKIIFLADLIEPGRDYPGVEKLRALAEKDLDRAVLKALDNNIIYIVTKGQLIHPNTIEARNYIIKELFFEKYE